MRIVLDLNKNLNKIASDYFDKSKKAKKKLVGAKKIVVETKKKLEIAESKYKETEQINEKRKKEKNRKKEWYETFRWFISSNGFLVIGGKDAGTNEVIIKKHTEPDDLVYHTEAPGSPFFVVKNEKRLKRDEIPERTKLEAATAAAIYSKAWSLNMRTAEVFEVDPEQVSKTAQSGEYISKGAFAIYGKKKFYNPIMELAVGTLKETGNVMCGPLSAVKKNCEIFYQLKQGEKKKGEISNALMKKLDLFTNDDIIANLPSGNFDFVIKEKTKNKNSKKNKKRKK